MSQQAGGTLSQVGEAWPQEYNDRGAGVSRWPWAAAVEAAPWASWGHQVAIPRSALGHEAATDRKSERGWSVVRNRAHARAFGRMVWACGDWIRALARSPAHFVDRNNNYIQQCDFSHLYNTVTLTHPRHALEFRTAVSSYSPPLPTSLQILSPSYYIHYKLYTLHTQTDAILLYLIWLAAISLESENFMNEDWGPTGHF